ncbi:MAG TPA: RDD family protein [Candidatus Dormibacteraeota bacterium]
MSLAGASSTAPISLAAATGHALPRRLVALIADTVVISLLDAIVNATFGVTRVTGGVVPSMASGSFASFTTQTTVDWIWLALLWVAYYAVLEGLFAATLGKLLAGVRVTDLEGRRIGWQPAILRNLARLIDALPFLYLLGGILTLSSRQHQRLGDRFAGTLVVPASADVGPPLTRDAVRRRGIGLAAIAVLLLALCAAFAYFGRPPLVIEGAKNTGTSVFGQGVGTFRLGSARWGNGKVTYPINYEIAETSQSCFGDITLTWTGFLGGWQLDGGQSTCSPRIYP